MTSILVSAFELGPPVWTLLNRHSDAIQTCRIMSRNPVDAVETEQLQELLLHDIYSSACF